MAITIEQLAEHRLGHPASSGADYQEARLPMLGGCEVCGASVAAYNSCPSKTGFIRCSRDCIEGVGFDTVEEAEAALAEPEEPAGNPEPTWWGNA